MSQQVKVCPECGEEYTLVPSECVDCGVALVFPDQLEIHTAPEQFPPTAELACVRVGPLPWTRALSAALEEAEIRHRVEPDSRSEAEGGLARGTFDGDAVFGTWVLPQKLEAAKAIDETVFAHVRGQEEGAPEATTDELCPACQSPLAIDALECADCGLPFG
jgi:rRNA maturation protein Nop10